MTIAFGVLPLNDIENVINYLKGDRSRPLKLVITSALNVISYFVSTFMPDSITSKEVSGDLVKELEKVVEVVKAEGVGENVIKAFNVPSWVLQTLATLLQDLLNSLLKVS